MSPFILSLFIGSSILIFVHPILHSIKHVKDREPIPVRVKKDRHY